ncbi:LEM-3-like GIY-YIG domain-containing protein [Maritalea mediterranea]|uniref:GIY-YIG domain-containing protein n=1 Tax=Maritalea mediterranea TaxID=2909667 RepID=A0ABS9EAB0_9HYPH|nr:hypothetical protein [Maritalea mediterranea]MCF4099782.1 hypothetical protein [Maritalea mediterranea]
MQNSFSPEVIKELGFYVYRLIDPRNGETFYIGKGKGNRVFHHIAGELDTKNEELNGKQTRIYEIKLMGLEVQHIIQRHGMDEPTAFEVEAALMDAFPGATNIAGGHGNSDRGAAHSEEIIRRYSAPLAELNHKIVEITVNRLATERSIYDATRFCWRVSRNRVESAELVLAIVNGLIVEVFQPSSWLDAVPENFPNFEFNETNEGRLGFVGEIAPEDVRSQYIHKRAPKRSKGAANPVRYWNM